MLVFTRRVPLSSCLRIPRAKDSEIVNSRYGQCVLEQSSVNMDITHSSICCTIVPTTIDRHIMNGHACTCAISISPIDTPRREEGAQSSVDG